MQKSAADLFQQEEEEEENVACLEEVEMGRMVKPDCHFPLFFATSVVTRDNPPFSRVVCRVWLVKLI